VGAVAESVADADSRSYSTPNPVDSSAFQCVGSAKAKAVFVREPVHLSEADRQFLAELKIAWRD
jgi:hypothetical protein